MKKSFTRIMAALALLVFMAPSMVMWGQSTHTIGWGTASGEQGTYTNFTATTGTVQDVLTFSSDKNSSQNAPAYNANASELRLYYASNGDGGSITIFPANGITITGAVMTTSTSPSVSYYVDGETAVSVSASSNTYTISDISASTSLKIQNVNTTNTQLRIKTIALTYTTNGGTPTCASPSFDPAAGAVASGTTVSISSTEGATIYYTTDGTDPNTNSSTYSSPIEITEATTIKAFATKEGYNNSEIATAAYTIKTFVPGYVIDFESDLDCYVDWEFTNIGIHTTGLTEAHSGSAWGSNVNENDNATTTASIQTKEKVAYPSAFTCYISKESGNTTASSWIIQVSSDGSSWDDIATLSSMTQNTWKEFTGDIKAAGKTNVFVRLYYSGSNAKRAVDDISLTTYTPVAVETPIIVVPEEFTISTTATITCVTEGATIYYSFDNTNWNEYTEALTITETKTIFAKAVKGSDESEIAQVTTTKVLAVPTVTISSTSFNIGETAVVSVEETGAPTITLSTSDATIATVSETTVTGVAAGSATITATWSANNDYSAGAKDFTIVVTDPNVPGGQNNPYTVAQAIENTPSTGNVYIHGIVSSFYKTSIIGDGTNYRYYISDDGTTTNQLLVYKGKGLNQVTFANADDLLVGDIVTIYGKLTTFNDEPEVASGNYLTSWVRPETPAQEYTLTIANPANVTITAVYGTDGTLSNGDDEDIESGTEISVTLNVATGYVLDALTVTGENNQTVTVTENNGVYTFNMPAFNVTVNATVSVATTGTYTLATSIESGKQYIIVGQANSKYYAMGDDKGNNRNAYEITLNGTTATANIANTAVHEFTISSLATEGYYSIMDATTSGGYLYAASSGNNYLKTESTLDENHNGDWKITVNDGSFSVVAGQSSNRNVMQFNNSSQLFACYASASQHPVFLYVKEETPVTETYTLTIDGYAEGSTGGYYLIASPVTVDPATVEGLTEGTYDLYYFDQEQELEWINYKDQNDGGFNLEPGKGYLYAKKATTEGETFNFTLTGTAYNGEPITLAKTEGGDFPGWNLVGNPYNKNAYIGERDFYVMNAAGGEIEVANDRNYIKPMEGVFVIATEDGEELTFSTEASANNGKKLALNVTGTRGNVIDRAIVRFGEGGQLPKFQLNPSNTKIYFAQGDNDYAVVRSASQADMPVSFKAAENGTYTLSFEAENTEMRYMHLIDNMTGNDIDLLATPSYSFEANTNDYANRFRIVFKANNGVEEMSEEHFAFFNGSEWVISNEGEATLQVIDMMGRVLSSETINGNANVKVNEAKGVYVIRMIQNGQVKNQKIVKE